MAASVMPLAAKAFFIRGMGVPPAGACQKKAAMGPVDSLKRQAVAVS